MITCTVTTFSINICMVLRLLLLSVKYEHLLLFIHLHFISFHLYSAWLIEGLTSVQSVFATSKVKSLCLWGFSMKFLEYTPLDRFNLFLSHLRLGESTIRGSLEAYSCKHTVFDRKLSVSLEHEILDYLGQSSDGDSPSSVDYLFSRSRKTLIYLILTLSHMYPDYDFSSAVQAHLFFKEEEWDNFGQIFDTYMFEAAKEWALANDGDSLLESMSKAIDEVVKLDECEIYSYNPDFDGDPFLEKGTIWSFNFFFYNRKLKRVVSFRSCCSSNLGVEGYFADEKIDDDANKDDVMFNDMDM